MFGGAPAADAGAEAHGGAPGCRSRCCSGSFVRAQGGRVLAGPLRAGVLRPRGEVFTGASYTDVNALLPAKTILVFVVAVCAAGVSSPTSSCATSCCRPRRWCCCWSPAWSSASSTRRSCSSSWSSRAPTTRRRPTSSGPSSRRATAYGLSQHRVRRLRAAGHRHTRRHQAALAPCATTPDHRRTSGCSTRNVVSRDVHAQSADPQRLRLPREARHRPVHDRRQDPATTSSAVARAQQRGAVGATRTTGSTGTPSTPTATGSSPPRPTRSSPGSRAATPNFRQRPGDLPTPRQQSPVDGSRGSTTASSISDYSDRRARRRRRAPRVRPARGGRQRADQQHLHRQGRRRDRQLLPPADVRDLLPRAQLPALRRGQRRRPRCSTSATRAAGGEGGAVPQGRRRPVPGGRSTAGSPGSSTATRRRTNYPYSEQMQPGRRLDGRAHRHRHDRAAQRARSTTSATR